MRVDRGVTLLETIIACAVMGVLITAVFMIYQMGVRAWTKTNTRSYLLQSLQTGTRRVTREAGLTIYDSVSITPDRRAISFLTSGNGMAFEVDDQGRPKWDRYVIFYHDTATDTLRFTEQPYAPVDPTVAERIEVYTGNPLATYANGGKAVADRVTVCSFSVNAGKLLELEMTAQHKHSGASQPEVLNLTSTIRFSN